MPLHANTVYLSFEKSWKIGKENVEQVYKNDIFTFKFLIH